jgi:FKBP-type peptidyl-prolyl cis-trans isomerase FkpA/FKBP-type peptidyl-prolyl cis-trans isomerase FklB
MRLTSVSALLSPVLLAALLSACAQNQEPPSQQKAMTENDKTLYTLGVLISKNLETFQLTAEELERVKQGLSDGVSKKTLQVELEKYGPKVDELHQTRLAVATKQQAEAGQTFLAKASAEPGATKTASGLIIKELKPGTGASPKATDQVKVHYQGTLPDGQVFDSSIQRGEPVTFPLSGVISCWTEGLQLMKVGGKSRLVCPADIAYGERGSPPIIKPGATLVFEVELLDIVH